MEINSLSGNLPRFEWVSLGHPFAKLNLDLRKERRMEKTHFLLREDEILLSSSLPKSLSKLERKIFQKHTILL
ncbi:hypothetical protein H5410_003260 [Solanum commersonii]|uniref:Uncharacterized protein n=1 Tax=Solanum commersonii TaxID=4109 RepID=A0A9J6B556_SOLCO|nr:hypothetical protein H5410_003260 [Solanum commersonii]